ncbi:MAG: YidC/Oxa1 family insertase periplasmic-domain containing protein [Myxococcaceae bacterium]
MDQQKRLLLAIALSFGLTLVWTQLVWKPQAEAELAAQQALLLDGGVDAGAQLAAVTPPTIAPPPPVPLLDADGGVVLDADGGVVYVAAPTPPAPPPEPEYKEVTLERLSTKYVFSNEGAGLISAELLGNREREERPLSIPQGYQKLFGQKFDPPPHMDLAHRVPGVGPNLAVSILGGAPVPSSLRYTVAEQGPGKVVFTARQGPWEITKTFTWRDEKPQSATDPASYLAQLAVTVKNVGGAMLTGDLAIHALRAIDPGNEQAPSMFGGIGNQASVLCRAGDDVARKIPPSEGGMFSCGSAPAYEDEKKGLIHFVGIDQQYFLTAIWPLDGALPESRCLLTARPAQRGAAIAVPFALGANESVTKRFGVFLGPKDLSMLQGVGAATLVEGGKLPFDPQLDKTVDFGLWAVICKILIGMLRLFFGLTGNWGVSIILLTVTVKVLLVPLTHKSMVNAEKMKAMQPKMDEIRKKWPDDQVKQIEEMRKAGIDPMANLTGCLPILVQLPIWAALFTTLRTSYELYGEPFFGVWSNLTSKDPTYLLPLALGITMLTTQRLQPQMSADKTQQILLTWVMPIFFTAIMMNYPAGLALYIFTNNLLSIVQQFALRRYLKGKGQLIAPAAGAGAAK